MKFLPILRQHYFQQLAVCLYLSVFAACTGTSSDSSAKEIERISQTSDSVITAIQRLSQNWYDSTFRTVPLNGSMIVAKNGKIIFERHNGTMHLDGNDTIHASSVFHIASTSKTFTAAAVLKLCDEQKIALDSPVATYLSPFPYPGVTIRQLLNHRSGLPNYLYFIDSLQYKKDMPLSNQDILDCMRLYKRSIKGTGKPNVSFLYCNTNYVILALIIEKVTGLSFPAYLHQTIFEPYGLNNTFVATPGDSLRITPSYKSDRKLYPLNRFDLIYGDKNVYSTVDDLLRWSQVLDDQKYISPSAYEKAYTSYSFEKPGKRNYGLGWRLINGDSSRRVIYHNGWWHGNNAVFLRAPHEKLTIILLNNVHNNSVYAATNILSAIDSIYHP